MKLLYTTKKFRFTEPSELQQKMLEYLDVIQKENQPYSFAFCTSCGAMGDYAGECCDTPRIEHKLMTKPTYEQMRPSLYGFLSFVGMNYSGLKRYENLNDEFKEVVEWFKTVLQMDLEQLLLNPMNKNVAGAKFVAVNNYGWKDKQELDHMNAQPITFVNDLSKETKWLK